MHPRWPRCSSLKYCPIFSVVAPCHRGASPASVRRRDFHHGLPGVKLTYDDYAQLPEDGKRHELIDGEHYGTPTPIRKHQAISGNLHGLLWTYLRQNRIGRVFTAPFDVIFSDVDVVEPDLLSISNQRLSEIETSPWVKGAPDLVVEIGSPGTRKRDETTKRRLYERFRVTEYR